MWGIKHDRLSWGANRTLGGKKRKYIYRAHIFGSLQSSQTDCNVSNKYTMMRFNIANNCKCVDEHDAHSSHERVEKKSI